MVISCSTSCIETTNVQLWSVVVKDTGLHVEDMKQSGAEQSKDVHAFLDLKSDICVEDCQPYIVCVSALL
jgi:hypothetical protein